MDNAQAVVMGEKVYIGGGFTDDNNSDGCIFQYDLSKEVWSCLPPCQVSFFAMAQFAGNLITVGGSTGNGITGKVYCFKEQVQKWEEFLKPMPTARTNLSAATTHSAIVASGGARFRDGKAMRCATVEVYSGETSQWHTADPLPIPIGGVASVIIADICYLLGGGDSSGKDIPTVQYAPFTALIQKATSPTHQSTSHMSVWKTLPDTPLTKSAAGSLSGSLLSVGGFNDKISASTGVHVFFSCTNSWVRVTTGSLPKPRYACTTVQLSSNQVLIVGGYDNQGQLTKTVFLGSITIDA